MDSEEFATLRFGETGMGAIITEINRRYNETKRKGDMFFIDFFMLLNTFGVYRAHHGVLNIGLFSE